ncbi:TIGR01777 family oxidoreductase [Sphingobacterium sp. SRCM116780]|uniref:TIGR01777 family oxidoreductase n=1 Tax=Sphingobacterium sp. SRCM116780 TaxID=2907623 RepID=UPI001F448037|nr:TIGR01777 family oxidoreductase [Sphingobacterium sp. SRCM116780]UIR54485.1 TIGR01777 family oxidoreductase [Sphingobacterium sp. SRCM116780]
METVIITGGTGTVGKQLTKLLIQEGFQVILFTRNPKFNQRNDTVQYIHWDPNEKRINSDAIKQADYIINLAGASITDKRWTKKRRQEIISSRVNSSELLVEALQRIPNKVKAVISTSAVGWYGADKEVDHAFSENEEQGTSFLSWTCKLWEDCIKPVELLHKRVVILRLGVVFTKNEGALKKLTQSLKYRMATYIGSGKQVISWIHITDLCHLYLAAIRNPNLSGIYNAVSSEPLSQKTIINRIAKQRFGFLYLPLFIPSFIIKFAMGQMADEVLLTSTTASNQKILQTGFLFKYPTLDEECIKNL